MEMLDITGQKFNRLTVLRLSHKDKGIIWWTVQCDCGTVKQMRSREIRSRAVSCGCYLKEIRGKALRRHGMSDSPTHISWQRMRKRCDNSNDPAYPRYGGRGISYDPRWAVFENFLADMGEKPSPELSIERIDNNGNYCKDNCKWATATEQVRNRSTSLHFVYQGRSLPLIEISKLCGVKYKTLHFRLKSGWSFERAVSERIRNNYAGRFKKEAVFCR